MPRVAALDIKASLYAPTGTVTFTMNTDGWTGFTASAWFKSTKTRTNSANVLARSAGFTDRAVQLNTTDGLRFCLQLSTGTLDFGTTKSFPAGTWNHYVATYDGAIGKVYVNGILEGSSVPATPTPLGTGQGNNWSIFNNANNPYITSLAIWNRGLSITEATGLYQSGTLPTSGLQRYYPLNEGAGTIAYDLSGNSQNGTINSPLLFTSDTPTKLRKSLNGNLVYNGDFEYAPPFVAATSAAPKWVDGTATGSTTNDLFGWGQTSATNGSTISFDSVEKKSGNYSIKLSLPATGSRADSSNIIVINAANVAKYCVPARPGVEYTLSYWMKTNLISGSSEGAYMRVTQRDAAGVQGAQHIGTKVNTTTDWTQYTITFTASPTTTGLQIQHLNIGTTGAGTLIMDAWFDDISLVETTPVPRLLNRDMKASLSFDGVDDMVSTSIIPSTSGWGIAFWYNADSYLTNNRIVDAQDSGPTNGFTVIQVGIDKVLQLAIKNGSTTTSTIDIKNLAESKWHHIAFTFDGSSSKGYLNGSLIETDTSVSMSTPTTSLVIGRRSPFPGNAYKGKLSQVIYKNGSGWTNAEVMSLYTSGQIPTGSTIVSKLDEGAGTTALDSSGNNNNGTITGATYSADTPSKARQVVNANMVKNGDFEYAPPFVAATTAAAKYIDGTTSGPSVNLNETAKMFGGWALITTNGSGSAQYDSTVSRSGTYSMKVSNTGTGGNSLVGQGTPTSFPNFPNDELIRVNPSTQYILTAWVKTFNVVTNSVYVDVREYSSIGNNAVTTSTNKLTGTNDWTQVTATFTTAATSYYARLFLRNSVSGNISDAWFDDIVLKPTTAITRTVA